VLQVARLDKYATFGDRSQIYLNPIRMRLEVKLTSILTLQRVGEVRSREFWSWN